MTTQVPKVQFTEAGVAIPDELTVLDGVLSDMDAAFGGGMSKSLSTPQGQLAQSLTAIIGDKNSQILEVSNQIDPARNSGRWQDAIGRIYFMERKPGRGTVVQATCYGLVGTVIPAGSLAQDASGYIYASTGSAMIGENGSVSVQFQNQTQGPIVCPVNSLTTIYVAVTGWERIDNTTAGTPGELVEDRYAFEQRRRNSVGFGGMGTIEAMRAALLSIAGVADVYVTDNPTGAAVTRGVTNYSIAAHSLYMAVSGGASADIAKAIHQRKSAGCGTVGTTTYTLEVTDGYTAPYPQYTYKWQVPTAVPVYFKVDIANDSRLQGDIVTAVRNSILSDFAGKDGGIRATIGSKIYAGRFYAGVQKIGDMVRISSITLGFTGAAGQNMVELGIDQLPTLGALNIAVNLV